MKISQVAVEVVRVPVDHPYTAGARAVDANWHVLARITTSDAIEGIGYIVYPRPDLMTTIGSAARELGEHLIGMSVLEPEAAWEKLARRGDWVGPGGLLHCALAPLDIAVWDANGKTLGQPLHRLLGGFRDRLPTYASVRLVLPRISRCGNRLRIGRELGGLSTISLTSPCWTGAARTRGVMPKVPSQRSTPPNGTAPPGPSRRC